MSNFYTDVILRDSLFDSVSRVSVVSLLEPVTRAHVQNIIVAARLKNIELMIFETYRSKARQEALFAQGATKLKLVGVHHYGLACDIVRSVNGEFSWKGDFSFLADLARENGLISGIDWGQPGVKHDFVDSVHVQRVTVARQPSLLEGRWYPDADYNPWDDLK